MSKQHKQQQKTFLLIDNSMSIFFNLNRLVFFIVFLLSFVFVKIAFSVENGNKITDNDVQKKVVYVEKKTSNVSSNKTDKDNKAIKVAKRVVEENNSKFLFLKNLKTLRTKYTQTEYTKNGEVKTSGMIIVKKPNSVFMEHNGRNMNIKLSYVGKNLKIIDVNLGQTTFLDSKYGELIQFFTNSIDNKKMFLNSLNELCIAFKLQDNQLYACIDIDENAKQDNDKIKGLKMYMDNGVENSGFLTGEIMSVVFYDTILDGSVEDNEFFVKDTRIFDDDED